MVIIGAGPAGSMAALTGARLGLEVLLVERDPVVGSPVRCAEGVDEKGLRRFFEPDPRWTAAEIDSYYLVAPNGDEVKMSIMGLRGYILERAVFDRMIAQEAAKSGASVRTGVEATGLSEFSRGSRSVTLRDNSHEWEVRGRVVVAADGVESRAARWAGLDTHCSLHDMETCAQATLAGIEVDPRAFYLYFTREFAPGGYAWVFPKGHGVANVGLGISGSFAKGKSPIDYLEGFIERRFPGASVVSRTVGGVQCSGGVEKICADGLMVCGDAAHMANPLTGGGIINAMAAGEIAAETAAEALKKGGTDERNLRPYQKRCDRRFGKMNRLFHLVKEGIIDIPNERLNALAEEMLKLPVEKRTPVRVLRAALVRNPFLLKVLAKLVF